MKIQWSPIEGKETSGRCLSDPNYKIQIYNIYIPIKQEINRHIKSYIQ